MRYLICIGILMLVGCTAPVVTTTEEQARMTCDDLGFSEAGFNNTVALAERDRDDGFSAAESKGFASGGCTGTCDDPDDDANCFSDCTTCANAVIDFVFSQ